MKIYPADTYSVEDWVAYFRRTVNERFGRPVATPTPILTRMFTRLKDELEPCLLFEVLDYLIDPKHPYTASVGPNEGILAIGVIHYAVNELGGYDKLWLAIHYKRFCQTEGEYLYFNKYLSLYEDAVSAPPNSIANVWLDKYSSWDTVQAHALMKLDHALDAIRERCKCEGPQETKVWDVSLEPIVPNLLVSKAWKRLPDSLRAS